MPSVAESERLVEGVLRLRRAERVAEVAADVAPVRRELESRLGPTLSRSRAARILGVSQTALDRWVAVGQVPVVIDPRGRRAVPRQFVVEAREELERLSREGSPPHPLAAVLAARRSAAAAIRLDAFSPSAAGGHATADRRGRAYHAIVAERLDRAMLEDARERLERLVAGGHIDRRHADRWRRLLARPPEQVARAIVADDEQGRDLRQNTPFAGVLNEQERRRIIEATSQ
ncbi:MAG TPA: hypothetical protein VH703_05535 [Solirubrobacterales bacterium]|jgi:hypothetical protein